MFYSQTRQSSPFFLFQPANDMGEATGVSCAAARDWRKGREEKRRNKFFSPVPRGRASHTSRLPRTRAVRWLEEKRGTALQSIAKQSSEESKEDKKNELRTENKG